MLCTPPLLDPSAPVLPTQDYLSPHLVYPTRVSSLPHLPPPPIQHPVRDEQVPPEEVLCEIVKGAIFGAEAVCGCDAGDAGEFVHVLGLEVKLGTRRDGDGGWERGWPGGWGGRGGGGRGVRKAGRKGG